MQSVDNWKEHAYLCLCFLACHSEQRERTRKAKTKANAKDKCNSSFHAVMLLVRSNFDSIDLWIIRSPYDELNGDGSRDVRSHCERLHCSDELTAG